MHFFSTGFPVLIRNLISQLSEIGSVAVFALSVVNKVSFSATNWSFNHVEVSKKKPLDHPSASFSDTIQVFWFLEFNQN